MNPETNPMPFDGKRMIFGGFVRVLELGVGAHQDSLAARPPPRPREAAGKDKTAKH